MHEHGKLFDLRQKEEDEEKLGGYGDKENSYKDKVANYKKNRKKMHSVVGTPDYIAPEVFDKSGYTEIIDWWSIGAIFFEMLVGHAPFCSNSPRETCRKVSEWRKHLSVPKNVNIPSEAVDLIYRLMSDESRHLSH